MTLLTSTSWSSAKPFRKSAHFGGKDTKELLINEISTKPVSITAYLSFLPKKKAKTDNRFNFDFYQFRCWRKKIVRYSALRF